MIDLENVQRSKTGLLKVKVVDWSMIKSMDVDELRNTRDRAEMKSLIKDFLRSDSLFVDPNYCDTSLVFKYFKLLQIAVQQLAHENSQLRQIVEVQKEQLSDSKEMIDQLRTIPPQKEEVTIIYQCPLCFKQFKSKEYLELHKSRRHGGTVQIEKVEEPKVIKKPIIDINKIVQSTDQTLKERYNQQKQSLEKKFSDFEHRIQERLEADRKSFIRDKFPGYPNAEDSVFGSTLNTTHVPLILDDGSDYYSDEYLSSIFINDNGGYSSDSF